MEHSFTYANKMGPYTNVFKSTTTYIWGMTSIYLQSEECFLEIMQEMSKFLEFLFHGEFQF